MVITCLGGECVKVQFGDIVLAFNPPSKESKFPLSRFGADVALITVNHPDFNGADTLRHGDRQPFVIAGPGAYEIKEVIVRGAPTETRYGGEPRINTVYSVILEGIKLCFLGALSSPELPAELKEELNEIDILFVPIGGEGVLDASSANKLAVSLEPKVIIPIHTDPRSLKFFLKESGDERNAPEEKLTIRKKDLEGREGDIVVLRVP